MSSTRFNPPYPLIEDTNNDGTTFNKDDISQAQKETLGYYLSSLTKGSEPGLESGQPFKYDGQLPLNHAVLKTSQDLPLQLTSARYQMQSSLIRMLIQLSRQAGLALQAAISNSQAMSSCLVWLAQQFQVVRL